MMGVGAKRALGLYRSCAPRQPSGKARVVSKNTNELRPGVPWAFRMRRCLGLVGNGS